MNEEWKMFHGYRVSNTGRCQWNDNGVWREKKAHNKNGSIVFVLRINGRKQKRVAKTKLLYELFGIEKPTNILAEKVAMQRITDKHGNKFTPISEYTEAKQPMLFRCNVCGCEFEETPHHVAIYDEPCKQCRANEVEANRRKRKELIKKEREARLLPDSDAHIVYAYVFDDGHAYVGLTCCPRQRFMAHRRESSSSVYQYSQESGKPIPEPTILEADLSAKEARTKEVEWIERMSKEYDMLNKVQGGSLGGLYVPHTLEEAMEIASHYSTRKEIKDAYAWAYDLLERHGKLPPKCKSHGGLLQRFQRRTRAEQTIKWG